MDQASVSDQLHFIGIEHYDEFPDAVLFWVNVSNPPRETQKAAKAIDGQDYRANSFGMCILYERASNRYDIVTDTDQATGDSRNIFYIDHDGDKHWFRLDISNEFASQIFAACSKAAIAATKSFPCRKGKKSLKKGTILYER